MIKQEEVEDSIKNVVMTTGNLWVMKKYPERFIELGGIPSYQMPKPLQVVIGKKWVFLSGSLAGGSITPLLTAMF